MDKKTENTKKLKSILINRILKDKVKAFFLCECNAEGVMVSKYDKDEEVYLSFWRQGINPLSLSLRNKFRLIWQILSKGTPFEDEVVLSSKNARKLGEHLIKVTTINVDKKEK